MALLAQNGPLPLRLPCSAGTYIRTRLLPLCDTENVPVKSAVKFAVLTVNLDALNPVMLLPVAMVQLYGVVLLKPVGLPVRSMV